MSLYGRTDSNANKTKAGVGIAASSQAKTTIYIDETEAALEANKERGLNAPGWWSYFSYTDSSGATRHKAEQLVFVAGGDTNANETQADDAQAADANVVLAIGTQPADTAVAVGAQLQLTVVATATPPGDNSVLTYQCRRSLATVIAIFLVQLLQHTQLLLMQLLMLEHIESRLIQPMVVKN